MMYRKSLIRFAVLAIAIVLSAATTAFAGGTKEQGGATTQSSTTMMAASNTDPLGKLANPVEISFVVLGSDGMQYDATNTPSDNWWTRWAADKLNIKPKLLWSTTNAQSQQKWQLAVASGDLPDILPLGAKDFGEFQRAGQLEDITSAYNTYASPKFREFMAEDNGNVFKQAQVNDTLYAIPRASENIESGHMIWVRTDWLRKLGLQPPKTMDDLVNIAKAFATKDPDGNGKDDTIGFEINKDLLYGFGWALGGIDGFFNGFHSYPTSWVKDSSGKLVYGGILPETRAALLRLQDMYKNGIIDREFGVKDSQKILEDVTAGKIGLLIGPWWHPEYPLTFNQKKDPTADWKCYPLVSVDSQPARPGIDSGKVGRFFALKKGFKSPEAFIKLFNLYINEYYQTPQDYQKIEWLQFAGPVYADPGTKDLMAFHDVTAAIKSGDSSKLNGLELANYQRVKDYLDGKDNEQWWAYKEYYDDPKDPTGFSLVQNLYIDGGLNLKDAYLGPDDTKAMVQYSATLQKLQKEMITKVITGAPISEFDAFVTNWKKLGGDQITQDVNDWAAANMK